MLVNLGREGCGYFVFISEDNPISNFHSVIIIIIFLRIQLLIQFWAVDSVSVNEVALEANGLLLFLL